MSTNVLGARAVHVDKPLTNLTIAYLQDESSFVAGRAFPQVPVDHQSDKYYEYDRANFNRKIDTRRGERSRSRRVGMSLSQDSYFAEVFSLSTDFTFRELANQDTALDIRSAGSRMLMQNMLIDREARFAEKYFQPGLWQTDVQGVAAVTGPNEVVKWSDYDLSTPIKDVTDAHTAFQLQSGGIKANRAMMSKRVRDTLVNHPDFLERIQGGSTTSNPAEVNDRLLAAMFGVDEILVMEAVQNVAPEGLPEDNQYIAGDHFLLFHSAPTPGLMVPSAGYTFTWNDLDNASGYGVEVNSFSGDWLAVDGIAEMIEVNLAYDQKLVGASLGYFFANIL